MDNFLNNISDKILIVDNEQSQIDELAQVFKDDFSIEPKTHLYEQSSIPDVKFSNIKIAFFDLHLTPQSFNFASDAVRNWEKDTNLVIIFNTLAVAIQDLIDNCCYPYVLIFWTSHNEFIDGFKDFMTKRQANYPDFPFPISIDCLDKNKFSSSNKRKQILVDKLQKTFFYGISTLEEIVFKEIENLKIKLIDLAEESKEIVWAQGSNPMQLFLQNLTVQTFGKEVSKSHPSKALTESLIPILSHDIVKAAEVEKIWDKFLNMDEFDSSLPFSQVTKAKLNNIMHIDNNPNTFSDRGTVWLLKNSSCDYDFFKNSFNNITCEKFTSLCLQQNLNADEKLKVSVILVEISAACDYSNNKPRGNKYIMGVKIPKSIYGNGKKFKSLPESIFKLNCAEFYELKYEPNITDYITEETFYIFLNLNFTVTLNDKDEKQLIHLFTFKKEMMDFIGNRYANHVSRIGVTSF